MALLNRIRVIIFAFMVFGAFANFAQNGWGLSVILISQSLICLSFFVQAVMHMLPTFRLENRRSINYIEGVLATLTTATILFFAPDVDNPFLSVLLCVIALGILFPALFLLTELLYKLFSQSKEGSLSGVMENYFLFVSFLGAVFKNMLWPGASMLSVLGIMFLFLYYFISGVKFINDNYTKGRLLVVTLSLAVLSTLFLGLSVLFAIQHWFGGKQMLYSGFVISFFVILFSVRGRFSFENRRMNIFEGFLLYKNHILVMYIMALVFCSYRTLADYDVAPSYYSQYYPASVDKFRNSGQVGKAAEISNVYNDFIIHSKSNGFEGQQR